MTDAASNMPSAEIQQQRRPHVVHRSGANGANNNRTMDVHLKIVCLTWSRKNKKQHAIGYWWSHNEVHGRQLMIWHTAAACRELGDQYIVARNGKPPRSTKALVRTHSQSEHRDGVSSGRFAADFGDKNHQEWTKQA